MTSSTPTSPATLLATWALSPVSRTGRRPSRLSCVMAAALSRLTTSATTRAPA